VIKQVYRVKYDGRKDKSSDLNATIEKLITLLKNSDIVYAKSKQKKVRVPTVKGDLPLSKKEMKPRCSLGLPKRQENKLHKFSAKKLKEKGLAWISKRSFQTHKDNAQASSAVKIKERRRFKK
jgi:hypothetical protein